MPPAKKETQLMTKEECKSRHKTWRWGVGLVATAILALPVWAVSASHYAEKIANQVDTRLQSHEAGEEVRNEWVDKTLLNVETLQEKTLDKIDGLQQQMFDMAKDK